MQERILVTGATGTVGTALVKRLSNLNVKVRAGVHSLIKGENLKYPNVELCEIEYHKPESLRAAFTGVDRVFLITPFSLDQVEMGKVLIDAAKDAGVKHIVRLSAAGADSENAIQLGRWHREIENYLENSGLNYTILRPSTFMQNFVNYAGDSIRRGNSIFMPLGEGKVSYIDVRDIADVAAVVLTTDQYFNQALEITGPGAVSVQEVAQAIATAVDRPIQYVDVPEEGARQSMLEMHMPEWMVNAMMELNAISKAGYAGHVSDTIQRVTGRQPHTIQEFAHQYAECFLPE
jgi:uncharacterized protein YbjT (DUF2867 family)